MEATRQITLKLSVPNDNAVVSSIWAKAVAAYTAQAEAEAEMEPGSLKLEPGTAFLLQLGEDETRVQMVFSVKGHWVAGPAE